LLLRRDGLTDRAQLGVRLLNWIAAVSPDRMVTASSNGTDPFS
jgi:hypothetical protein